MSLDLSQNIILYLSLITSLVSIIVLLYVTRQSNNMNRMNKTMRRLKFEVSKMQESDRQLVKTLTNVDPGTSWIQEDEQEQEEEILRKKKKKEKFTNNLTSIKSKIPNNFEQFIGEKVLDKIGIVAFLIGIAILINVSYELAWINNFGRLFFGIILTLIFLVLGYLLRNKYVHFSNILIGGGIASFIFSLFAAYYQYHLIPLILWIILTIFVLISTIIISISVKRHEIAVITFLAAYIAPFTVKFIGSDYFILFSYITLLNVGIIIYDWFQKSLFINLLSYGFTFIIYCIWLFTKLYYYHEEVPYLGAFIFLTIFYILFFVIILINNVKEGKQFKPIEFTILSSSKAIYLSVGLVIINAAGVDYSGLFVGLCGIINYSYFLILYTRKNFDRRVLNIFLTVSIMFFSLIIPIEFYGKTITMVWAMQAAILVYVGIKLKSDPMKQTALLISVAMVVNLFRELYNQYLSTTVELDFIKPIFNRGFLTSIMVMGSIVTIIYILNKFKEKYFYKKMITTQLYTLFLLICLVVTLYFSVFFEIKYFAVQKYETIEMIDTVTSVYNIAFLTLFALPAFFVKLKPLGIVAISIALISGLLYIFFYSNIYITLRGDLLLSTKVSNSNFSTHYFSVIFILISITAALASLKNIFKEVNLYSFLVAFALVFLSIILISYEATNFYTIKLYNPNLLTQDIVKMIYKFPYSLIWAFTSFFFIIIGFVFNAKEVRISAFILYVVTFVKILAYDFWTVTNQDLMISFMTMGVIMLISSFLFQLKKNRDNKILLVN